MDKLQVIPEDVVNKSTTSVDLSVITSLCKRRGFLFQSSEIYGGLESTWDYGPLGVELKRNIKEAWWRRFVLERADMVGLDSAILMHPDVWKASGHIESFTDPLVECKQCNRRFREDQLEYVGESPYNTSGNEEIKIRKYRGKDSKADIGTVVVSGLHLTPQNSRTVLEAARLTGQNFSNDHPLNQMTNVEPVVEKDFILDVSTQLAEGTNHYTIGFEYSLQLSELQITLVFRNKQGILAPLVLDIDFTSNTDNNRPIPISSRNVACPFCGGELSKPRTFNLMFRTSIGPLENDSNTTYLRPETAQGIFVNFNNVVTATRRKLPFGIAQIGKAFRNEITTGNFIFRTREFEIMEIEYFVKPEKGNEAHNQWIEKCLEWFTDLGVDKERLRLRAHEANELAHYAEATSDIEYAFPWGWGEIQGIANRGNYDLKAHSKASGEQLRFFDDQSKEHISPYVIEPSVGVDRAVMTFLMDAYTEEEAPTSSGGKEKRVVLKLHPTIAPIKVAVLPLSRNEKLAPLAYEIYDMIRKERTIYGLVQYDDSQSIGRRYRRQDEVGTPICVTVDFESLVDNSVTIRERDSMAQIRIPINELLETISSKLLS